MNQLSPNKVYRPCRFKIQSPNLIAFETISNKTLEFRFLNSNSNNYSKSAQNYLSFRFLEATTYQDWRIPLVLEPVPLIYKQQDSELTSEAIITFASDLNRVLYPKHSSGDSIQNPKK